MTPPEPVSIPDFRLLRCIGRGAFGEVWLAQGTAGQMRAVKILHRGRNPGARNFEREFSGLLRYEPISRRQNHFVHILHTGRTPDGSTFWYVMELADAVAPAGGPGGEGADPDGYGEDPGPDAVTGGGYEPRTLRAELRRFGALPVSRCLEVALGLVEAVAHLHREGLVHRDIKPSNAIFVRGVPKLADIGLVALAAEPPSMVGTAGYVPPDGPGTPAADVYALGRVFYEMATGRPLPDFPKLPEGIERRPDAAQFMEFNEILLRAADPDPRRRYASIEHLRSDLLLLAAGRPIGRWRGMERRYRWVARAGAAVTGVALVAIILGFWANRERQRAERAEREASRRYLDQQLNLARSIRSAGRPGQRFRALELLREVARRTNSLEVRNEAIAAMSLPDVRLVREFSPSPGHLRIDPTGRRYATRDGQGAIVVRDLGDDHPVARFPDGAAGAGGDFLFSPDGRSLVSWKVGGPRTIWNLGRAPGGPDAVLPVAGEGEQLAWLPDGGSVVVGDGRGGLRLFSARDGRLIRELAARPSPRRVAAGTGQAATRDLPPVPAGDRPIDFVLPDLAFSPDGGRLAAWDSTSIAIHSSLTGEEMVRARVPGGPFAWAAWHPDGRRLVIEGQVGGALQVWSPDLGAQEFELFRGHRGVVVASAADAAGQLFATTGWDKQTILWDPMEWQPLLRIPEAGNYFQMDPAGSRLSWTRMDGRSTRVFELPPPLEMQRLGLGSHRFGVFAALPLPRSGVVIGAGSGGLMAWRSAVGWPSAVIQPGSSYELAPAGDGGFWTAGVQGLGHWPVTADAGRRRLRIGPFEPVAPVLGHVGFFAFARGETRLAATHKSEVVWLCPDRTAGAWIRLTNTYVSTLSMDAGGRFVVAGVGARGLGVWRGDDGAPVATVEFPNPLHARFSIDGRWLMAMNHAEFVAWEVPSWRVAARWPLDFDQPPAFAVSPRGPFLAIADVPAEVRLLEVGSWRELARFPAPPLLHSALFSPDGSRLALPSESTGIHHWDLREVRSRLRDLGCDWEAGPYPPPAGPGPGPDWEVVFETR